MTDTTGNDSLDAILSGIRSSAQNERDKGTAFERLVQTWLRNDPRYTNLYTSVWLWSEWPANTGQDTGIDLVAEGPDAICAIQCKFFDPQYEIKKSDIDSFFTASGKTPFNQRLIVTTTPHWSSNAEKALNSQHIPCNRITLDDIASGPLDWSTFNSAKATVAHTVPFSTFKHQDDAISDVLAGFTNHDRGKLIMACGTGKTFTALRLAEKMAAENGDHLRALFCVPSISLLNQTYTEWSAQARLPMRAAAVCSDSSIGKTRGEDFTDIRAHDLPFPATTNGRKLADQLAAATSELIVVFCTYQSLDVITEGQQHGLADFDLIVCDEAHRTTGVNLGGADTSSFTKVHKQHFVRGSKRLYMTATPRVYSDSAKGKAKGVSADLISMDDPGTYGPEFHRLSFGKAVQNGLLTDYNILVLAISETAVTKAVQGQLATYAAKHGRNFDDIIPDAAKIIGCANALAKHALTPEDEAFLADDAMPMHRAVVFAADIAKSKFVADEFASIIASTKGATVLPFALRHVDGTMSAMRRAADLTWLRQRGSECRILTNARCLTEGIDVPALDAILFLNPRDSKIDIIQAVGRVMRNADGKKYGYIILPVTIPAGEDPTATLDRNDRYQIVWSVLQALRSHDERLDAEINALDLNDTKRRLPRVGLIGTPGNKIGADGLPIQLPLLDSTFTNDFLARVVQKCGSRHYFPKWAADIAEITSRHAASIMTILDTHTDAQTAFDSALASLRKNINGSITRDDTIDMLAQHLVTKPVFDALLDDRDFSHDNPVSKTFDDLVAVFAEYGLTNELASLKDFYDSIRMRAASATTDDARQKLLVTLYDNFFQNAIPTKAASLGIVYTPVEIVDFILNSVAYVLQTHLSRQLTDENVHVLDPFTGTGNFLVRLIHSGLIDLSDLPRKYGATSGPLELHANERGGAGFLDTESAILM